MESWFSSSRSRNETKVAETVIWPRADKAADSNSNYYSVPPSQQSQPPSSPAPSSLPHYVSHLTVKELPSWTTLPRHQRCKDIFHILTILILIVIMILIINFTFIIIIITNYLCWSICPWARRRPTPVWDIKTKVFL